MLIPNHRGEVVITMACVLFVANDTLAMVTAVPLIEYFSFGVLFIMKFDSTTELYITKNK